MTRFLEQRKLHNYSQQQLANMLFVNQTAVSQWDRGVTIPSPPTLLKLSEIYGVSTDYLLGKEEKKEPASTDEDGQNRNIIKILGRDGSRYEAAVSDSQRELLKQMLDNLKPVDDENL